MNNSVNNSANTLVALCAVGAERVLGNEIKLLGYRLAGNAPGRVLFEGDDDALFRANLCLRTADRVYLLVARFAADDFDALFDGIYAVPWQDFFRKDTRVVVDKVRTYRSRLNSEHAVQGIVLKAIYQKLGDVWHMASLPESGGQSDVRIFITEDEVHVCLDLSGLPLHKRGYRTDGGTAPLRETTAAVLLQLLNWRRKTPLHDPFCGSGTIPVEACLYAYNVAPGFGRRFAVETLPFFDTVRAQRIREEEADKIRTDVLCRVTGTDIDPASVERARLNAEHACVTAGRALDLVGRHEKVPRPTFEVADFRDISAPYDEGVIVCNPPYGERLGSEGEAAELYRGMAQLFTDFPGWTLGVITANEQFQDSIGRYAATLKDIKAGNMDSTFYIYDGSENEEGAERHKPHEKRWHGSKTERRRREARALSGNH